MKISVSRILISLYTGIKSLFKRFPLTTSLVILEFIGLVLMVELDYFRFGNNLEEAYLLGLVLLANISFIFASITSQLVVERFNVNGLQKLLIYTLPLIILVGASSLFIFIDYRSFDFIGSSFTGNMYKLLVLILLSFLSIFSIPFLKESSSNEWWNFTVSSLFRASVSILYSIAIYIGLALALLALESFWDIKLFQTQYEVMAIFSFVLVAPLHFLHGMYEFSKVDTLIRLPNYLAILVKYILTPLIVIYTVILFPYIFSFPFKNEWPANEATGIILALHAMIYLGVILFYGVEEGSSDEKFKRLFTKIASVISIPTLLFWIYSLYLRIEAYGITVNRFVLMSLILWFLGTSVYLLFSKRSRPQYIVGGLFVVLAVVFYMPFTSFYWGGRDQLSRLVEVAKVEGLYEGGKIERGVEEKVKGNGYTMGEITNYLVMYNKGKGLEALYGDSLKELVVFGDYGYMNTKVNIDGRYSYIHAYAFASVYFENPVDSYPSPTTQATQYYTVILDVESLDIPEGYSTVNYVHVYYGDIKGNSFKVNGTEYSIFIDTNYPEFYNIPKNIDSREFSGLPESRYTDSVSSMSMGGNDGDIFILGQFNGEFKDGVVKNLDYVSGYLFSK